MPMRRHLYPADWEARALAVKEAADWKCSACGKQCRRPGEAFDTHRRTLTTAHVNHDPSNGAAELRALCAPCHLRHDAPERARRRKAKSATELAVWRQTAAAVRRWLRAELRLNVRDARTRATLRACCMALDPARNPRICAARRAAVRGAKDSLENR